VKLKVTIMRFFDFEFKCIVKLSYIVVNIYLCIVIYISQCSFNLFR